MYAIVTTRLLNITPFESTPSAPGGLSSKMIPARYPPGTVPAGAVTVNRTIPAAPGCSTCSTGFTRTQDAAEYGIVPSAGLNCGVPSFDR